MFECVDITAPTITSVKGYYDADSLLIGFGSDGVDLIRCGIAGS